MLNFNMDVSVCHIKLLDVNGKGSPSILNAYSTNLNHVIALGKSDFLNCLFNHFIKDVKCFEISLLCIDVDHVAKSLFH